jgi:hypothetical protein
LPLAQPNLRVRERGELCFPCPNQTKKKREGKEKRNEKKERARERKICDFRERKMELEREEERSTFGDSDRKQWHFGKPST